MATFNFNYLSLTMAVSSLSHRGELLTRVGMSSFITDLNLASSWDGTEYLQQDIHASIK